MGERVKTNKLGLFMEKFDVMQDFESRMKNVDMHKRNKIVRAFGPELAFMFNDAGEFYLYNTTSLAVASSIKLKDQYTGKVVDLFDAYEVVKDNNIARLQLRKGLTKLDGTAFTQDDERKFRNKSRELYQRFDGIYNKDDMTAFQRTVIGRTMMTFRKYLVPTMINRRWQKSQYNQNLEAMTEGFYRTFFRKFTSLGNVLSNRQAFKKEWDGFTTTERANILRTIADIGLFGITAILSSILLGA